MLPSLHIRAARGLLRWSARELAEKAGVSLATVQRIERPDGTVRGTVRTLARVQQALEAEGVDFLLDNGGPWVSLKTVRLKTVRRK